jgi:uncharacterized membrane protein
MTHVITRSYENYVDASSAVEKLKEHNIDADHISIIAKNSNSNGKFETTTDNDTLAAEGASVGGLVGAAAGLLAGIGIIAIPGVGPVIAAGWLASTAAGVAVGATTGGIVGAFINSGVSANDAHYYEETVRRGGAVVSVKAEASDAATVESILDGTSPLNPVTRRALYAKDGWSHSFEDNANSTRPYTRSQEARY